ncbi:hypothetical protein DM01DRAFT_1331280 [Hesseltinella vesiculosa]|uniref:Uncharacterized protein n=1 Tax=Hesseltinella vesiculosa TaxID=101127 RepID=A0A1X2GYW6_9FUNG|nr:hypothetical protein DM01DRAFT_1331280 [Hesseltinella vesiculosa]
MATSIGPFDHTPPSPTATFYRSVSPLPPHLDIPLSTTSSPESIDVRQISSSMTSLPLEDTASTPTVTTTSPVSEPSSPQKEDQPTTFKSACKRTLSRTRSQRRPVVMAGKKKNKSSTMESTSASPALLAVPPSQPPPPLPPHPSKGSLLNLSSPATASTESLKDTPLDHHKVMEALRAKLRRSSNPSPKDTTTNKYNLWSQDDPPPQPMSPQGMLLLDLKNPRKVFTNNKRTTMNPRVAVLRRPRPFASAHNHCDLTKDSVAST